MDPDIRHLKQFVAVAEAGGFSAAAARLGMAQPPLSQAIRKLEETLGTRLFLRTSRRVELTETGRALLEVARPVIEQHEQALRQVREAAAGRRGRLRVGFVMSASYALLPRIVRRVRAAGPALELVLSERTTAEQVEALEAGRQDVGLLRPPVFGAGHLALETLLAEPILAALPDSHRLAGVAAVQLADLSEEPFIAPPARLGPGLHARLLDLCLAAGFVPRVEQEAREMVTIASLVAGGLGVALMPRSVARLGLPGLVFRPLANQTGAITFDLALAWRRGAERDRPVLRSFLAAAAEAARGEPDGPRPVTPSAGRRSPRGPAR